MKNNEKSLVNTYKHTSIGLFSLLALSVSLTACQPERTSTQTVNDKNLVESGSPNTHKKIGDEKTQFQVLGGDAFNSMLLKHEIISTSQSSLLKEIALTNFKRVSEDNGTPNAGDTPSDGSSNQDSTSLVLGFPLGLLNQQNIFGAVITKVSDAKSETLGRLKLFDLPSLHVTTKVIKNEDGSYGLGLVGCVNNCSETSEASLILEFPILGLDTQQTTLIVDLSAIGSELNLVSMIDPFGQYTKLKAKESKTVAFDYSLNTLIFDINSHMIPIEADANDPNVEETIFTTRWYLKLTSGFNPAFVSRAQAKGVGFFTTERSAHTQITRFAINATQGESVHYFIKNVPADFQPAFAEAFDDWNKQFKELLGKELLTYEFVPETDPRNKLLVAGDVRFNIVEWDLDNLAPYGGLGPSIANQFTGETFSANVLIQGPHIVELYTKWFKLSAEVAALREAGNNAKADKLLLDFTRSVNEKHKKLTEKKYELKLGKNLAFRATSQLPSLEDPLMQRDDFDEVPAGFTFQQYMHGYFVEMLAHELGHNLGLRHNFRGNLGSTDHSEGNVSSSIMEYMGKTFRHLNRINYYDIMAIAYGYTGKAPQNTTLFCTDEDVAEAGDTSLSPECSRDDATADPFGFFEDRLEKAVVLLTALEDKTAPVWSVDDMRRELDTALNGLLLYAANSGNQAPALTHFFNVPGRPQNASEVKGFVLNHLEAMLCNPLFNAIANAKESKEAKEKTLENLAALQQRFVHVQANYDTLMDRTLSCTQNASSLSNSIAAF